MGGVGWGLHLHSAAVRFLLNQMKPHTRDASALFSGSSNNMIDMVERKSDAQRPFFVQESIHYLFFSYNSTVSGSAAVLFTLGPVLFP